MRIRGVSVVVQILATSLILAACSTAEHRSQTAGEQMSTRGAAISARGEAWTDGQRKVEEGQRLQRRSADRAADGEKRLRQAQVDKRDGDELIAGGMAAKQKAEAAEAKSENAQPAASHP